MRPRYLVRVRGQWGSSLGRSVKVMGASYDLSETKTGSGAQCAVLGGTLLLDSDITPEHRLLECVRPSLSNLEHYTRRSVAGVMFQVRQQKSKGLAQAVFRKTNVKEYNPDPRLDQTFL